MADLLGGNDIDDFERAANAFPDISLDGFGDVPSAPAGNQISNSNSAGFSFDDFDTPLAPSGRPVRVTGDDELEKFENEFPDFEVPSVPAVQVCLFSQSTVNFCQSASVSAFTTFVSKSSTLRTETSASCIHFYTVISFG